MSPFKLTLKFGDRKIVFSFSLTRGKYGDVPRQPLAVRPIPDIPPGCEIIGEMLKDLQDPARFDGLANQEGAIIVLSMTGDELEDDIIVVPTHLGSWFVSDVDVLAGEGEKQAYDNWKERNGVDDEPDLPTLLLLSLDMTNEEPEVGECVQEIDVVDTPFVLKIFKNRGHGSLQCVFFKCESAGLSRIGWVHVLLSDDEDMIRGSWHGADGLHFETPWTIVDLADLEFEHQ